MSRKLIVNREIIEVGQWIKVPMHDGDHRMRIMESNDLYFMAENNEKKIKVSFSNGRVVDLSEYGDV